VAGFRGRRVAIGIFGVPYSCPPGPYELALLLSERLEERGVDAEVSVFASTPIPLPILGAAGSQPLTRRLEERGITFLPGRTATSVHAGRVEFADHEPLPVDLLLAVPPHRVPPVLASAGLAPADGWVAVDPRTLATSYPGVHAIGDCTVIGLSNGMPMPKAGLFAQREGEVVAARVAAVLRGEEPSAEFDGTGACFVEMGGGEASAVRGAFFAAPPAVELTAPSREGREEKERFEAERLDAWFEG
jgi:sulfide:quinone oxidoreductase